MIKKLKVAFAAVPLAVTAITLSVAMVGQKALKEINADPTIYEVVLDSSNAPAALTTSFQRNVSAPVTTAYGNRLDFTLTNAKKMDNGYVTLGNYGTVSCITDDDHHISGIKSITVTFTGATELTGYWSGYNGPDGACYRNSMGWLSSGVKTSFTSTVNSFYLEAGESNVSVSSITIEYTCEAADWGYAWSTIHYVEDFESYDKTGVGYDGSHGMAVATGLRARYYSTYYGAGSDPLNGSGWNIMGSTDYLNYHATAGRGGTKTGLFKVNSGNYFHYVQAKHFFGTRYAVGRGSKLSAWMHGTYSNLDGTPGVAVEVTLIAYYNRILNKSGANDAATATYTIPAGSDWTEYTVDIDPTKTVYAYGIHLKKASATAYLPVDDVTIYTTSPYGVVHASGVQMSQASADMIVGGTKTLTATIAPANAANKAVTWSTSNSSVATVTDAGVVTAHSAGSATITVTTADGGFTDTCVVTVTQPFPGGTYFTTVKVQSYDIKIEVVCSTRAECFVYFYGMATDGARFTSYNASTGAFVIEIDGEANLGMLGTYTYGNMTGYARNDQLEDVALTGSISNLLGNINGDITIPHPATFYDDCDGSTSDLQNTFRRRWRNGSAWSFDDSNSNRIEADTVNKSSGSNGVKIRPYASGVGIVYKNALNNGSGITLDQANTFSAWIYNPSSSAVSFRIFLYKNTDFSSNFEPMGTKSIPANSWYHVRIGYGTHSAAGTVYNFMITNLGSGSGVTFVVDDIWFHK